MELRHLRYFAAVAEALSFTRAAAKLRLAQPALSKQVRDLEDEIGVDLLKRSPRGVTLTAEGKLFLKESLRLLSGAEDAIARTRALARGEYGELHIGYSPSPTIELLPPALKAFQSAVPQVAVHLHDLAGNELTAGLREGRLELAVMQRPLEANGAGLEFERLCQYPFCVMMPSAHPFARLRSIPLSRLSSERLVVFRRSDYSDYHSMLNRIFSGPDKRPPIAVECDGASSLFTEIQAGRGVAVLPRVFARIVGNRLVTRPILPAPPPLEVGIATAARADISPAAEKFRSHLRTSAGSL